MMVKYFEASWYEDPGIALFAETYWLNENSGNPQFIWNFKIQSTRFQADPGQESSCRVISSAELTWENGGLKYFDTSFSQPVRTLGVLLQPPPLELSPPTLPEVREKMTSLKKEVRSRTQIESQSRNKVRHAVHQPAASALHIDTTYLQVWGLGILLLGWRGRCPGPWCTPRNLESPARTHT